MPPVVSDNLERHRFEIHLDDELVGFADYRLNGQTIAFTHAEVSSEHEGQGLGSTLARESLEAAQRAGRAVLPACPFYQDYLQRHPEYVELVPESRRAEFDL
jgi:predicted GNAT family acetyltransferase